MRKIDSEYLKQKKCNLCGADDTMRLMTMDKVYDNNRYNIVRCKKCGLVYSDPMPVLPKTECAESIYNQAYYRDEMPYDKENKYITCLFETSCEKQASIIEKYVGKGRFLEIGCGRGMFMEVMQRRGWQVWGTEISDYATELCRKKGLTVFNADLKELTFSSGYFNCIMLGQVIEHLNDPNSAMEKVYQLCAKGGLVVISTENAEGLSSKAEILVRSPLQTKIGKTIIRRFLGRYPRGFYGRISPPVHLFYFSEKTVTSLLQKHGFQVIKIVKCPRGNRIYYPEPDRYKCNIRTLVFKGLDNIGAIIGKGEVLVIYARKIGKLQTPDV